MSTVNSAAAHTLDEEEIATKQHDQVSNDHSQNDFSEGNTITNWMKSPITESM